MSDDPSEFDDPGLKEALQRGFAGERAPAALRMKVTAGMAADAIASEPIPADPARPGRGTARASRRGWRIELGASGWRAAAAAAVVLLAVGYAVMQIRAEFFPERPIAMPTTSRTIPASFVLTVVRAHDNCAKLPDHHLVPGDDPDQLAGKLSQAEGVQVFAASLGDGWQFKGAGMCTLEDVKAAHLIFAKGDDVLSIFSMPTPSSCGGGHGGGYALNEMVENHALSGFSNANALYCVVGSSPAGHGFTLAELAPVVAKVRAALGVSAGCGSFEVDTVATSAHAH
jgi:hypothetical protein